METSLLESEQSTRKAELIRRIYIWSIIFLIGSVFTGFFHLYNGYKLWDIYNHYPDTPPARITEQLIANISFLALYGLMVPLQGYFFYRFARQKMEFVDNAQTEDGSPFKWLLKQAIVAGILFGINAIWGVINVLYFKY